MAKYYQMFHRYNFQITPPLEERVCVWFEWNGEVNDENLEEFEEVIYDALTKQQPPSWKLPFGQGQKKNMALGDKHHPELSWSTTMTCGDSVKVETPIFVRKEN